MKGVAKHLVHSAIAGVMVAKASAGKPPACMEIDHLSQSAIVTLWPCIASVLGPVRAAPQTLRGLGSCA